MIKWINSKRNKKGFTLIELIVVIAILGILAAIAIPRLTGLQESSTEKADKATAATIGKAAEIFAANHNLTETERGSVVVANLTNTTDLTVGSVTYSKMDLIKSTDTTPQQAGAFSLAYNATNKQFEVTFTPTGGTGVVYYPAP